MCTPKGSAEATGNSETAHSLYRKEECTIVGRSFASTAKNLQRQETKIWREFTTVGTIQNKMRVDKCNAYTTKETLGYIRRKEYVAVAKRGKPERDKITKASQ